MRTKSKKKSKILIIASTQGAYGGIEATVLAQAKSIRDCSRFSLKVVFKLVEGFEVQNQLRKFFLEDGIEFEVVNKFSLKLFKCIQWADLVHAHNSPPDVVLISKILCKYLLLTIHNKLDKNLSLHSLLWQVAFRLSDYRTYNSNFVLNTWETEKSLLNSQCIPTISKIPQSTFSNERRSGFVFISRWIENKGIDTLLKAYKKAKINKEEWKLTMIGDGPLKHWAIDYVRENNLNTVEMLGFVSDDVKFEHIKRSKWLVAPPNTNEDLGLTPIEARSFGIPSIVTADGGLQEAAGSSALVCSPKDVDGLSYLLERAAAMEEEDYMQRSEIAYLSLKAFLKPNSVYFKIYNNLLKN